MTPHRLQAGPRCVVGVALAGLAGLCTLLLAQSPSSSPYAPPTEWRAHRLGRAGDVELHFEHLPQASIADEALLSLTCVNLGTKPALVRRLDSRIEQQLLDRDSREVIGHGSFPRPGFAARCWDEKRSAFVFPPGVHRAPEDVSREAAAILFAPPVGGALVQLTLHVRLELEDGGVIETPAAGLGTELLWLPAREADGPALRARLRQLLANPEPQSFSHYCILDALLREELARRDLTFDEVAAAIERRQITPGDRRLIARRLHELGFPRDEVVAWFVRRLEQNDALVCADLAEAPRRFWADEFVAPLVALHGRAQREWMDSPMRVLDRQQARWAFRPAVTRALLDATLRRDGEALRAEVRALVAGDDPSGPLGLEWWARGLDVLGMCRDAAAEPLLLPLLDVQRPLFDWSMLRSPPVDVLPCYRVCDVALEALLRIRYGDLADGYEALAPEARRGKVLMGHEQANALRDRMIAALRRR
ncbi:MAG: hypothetical protein U1E73_10025 [Planctomycetota bacterium]